VNRTALAVAMASAVITAACSPPRGAENHADPWLRGRLTFRPVAAADSVPRPFPSGLHPVFADEPDGAMVYAPASAETKTRVPLVVFLHGAGMSAGIITRLTDAAEQTATIVVAPKSVDVTWDAMRGAVGPDVENIDRVLNRVARMYAIDPARISIAGFSDGATYALALGRLNGTLFRNIVAFSPGILIPVDSRGSPPIFISHGTSDTIIPIEMASRRFVPELRRQGYSVEYHEFAGPHAVPPDIAALAMRWIAER
jgi:phospholipase/carboxylesterase